MQVIKRNCEVVNFEKSKIENAILKAMKYGSGIIKPQIATDIAEEIYQENVDRDELAISEIEQMVFNKLIAKKQKLTARAYERYRSIREYQREENTIDDKVWGLINQKNANIKDNSNKNPTLISTMRDLVAEEVSKDIALRMMLPAHIAQAHEDGLIYIHDLGHYLNPSFNCCLVNLWDMLQNGTVINNKLITRPKSFRTACTIATQIIAQIASGQFGGQTISISHLAPFVRVSENAIRTEVEKEFSDFMDSDVDKQKLEKKIEDIVASRLAKEIKDGIQTFQYQINTLQTSNGRLLPL